MVCLKTRVGRLFRGVIFTQNSLFITGINLTMKNQNLALKQNFSISCLFAITLFFSLFSHALFAANGVNVDKRTGFAIHGYDPVAYFTQSKAVKGKKEFVADYKGNKWAFSSAAHQQTFTANPEKYLPQYGGYCAYAASKNSIAKIDPKAWTVHNNKLYLNYNDKIRSRWLKKVDKLIVVGDRNWPGLLKEAQGQTTNDK